MSYYLNWKLRSAQKHSLFLLYVRTVTFKAIFYSTLLSLGFIFCSLFYLFPQHKRQSFYLTSAKMGSEWAFFLLRWICSIKYSVRGLHNIPKEGPYFIASKHQSLLDSLLLQKIIPSVVSCYRSDLHSIFPLLPSVLSRSGCVSVNRDMTSVSEYKKFLSRVKETCASGNHMFFFPEGHRYPPGACEKFKPGIIPLYRELKIPCLPLALNVGLFWSKHSFLCYPGTAVFEFLPMIPPDMDSQKFFNQLQSSVDNKSQELLLEALGSLPEL